MASMALKTRLMNASRRLEAHPLTAVCVAHDLDRHADRSTGLLGRIAPAGRREDGDLAQQAADVYGLGGALLGRPREREQPLDRLRAVHRGPDHHLQRLAGAGQVRRRAVQGPGRQIAVAGHQPEVLVQVVRDAAGQLAERPQLLVLGLALAAAPLLRRLVPEPDHAGHVAPVVA
jgi:hypothetical protein